MRFVLSVSWDLIKMSFVMILHGIFPDWDRFNGRIVPFTKQLKEKLVVRQMAAVHVRLMDKALRDATSDSEEPTNGSLNGKSNGSL
jgi:hypothetical protein